MVFAHINAVYGKASASTQNLRLEKLWVNTPHLENLILLSQQPLCLGEAVL